MMRFEPDLSFFPLIFFGFFNLFFIEGFAFVETRSFPDVEYSWEAGYDIRLSSCPAVYRMYRCFPDINGNIDDSENTCEGVVPDYFHGCRRLDAFKKGSWIKITSVHDEDGNDITHNISPCFENPDQCFLGIVMRDDESIGYIPIVNIYSEGNQKVFFKDIKRDLSFLQRNIQEERNYFLEQRRSRIKGKQTSPNLEKPEISVLPSGEPSLVVDSTVDSKGVIEYESCNRENDYLEDLLAEDPMTGIQGFIEGLPSACTYTALKDKIKGHRYCTWGKSYYRKTPPCLSEKYHKIVHNSLMLVSRCVGIDEKILFDLFNTESSLHLSVGSSSIAGGPAQLTGIFIKNVNQRLLDQTDDWNSEACLEVKFFMPEKEMSPEKICDRFPSDYGSSLQNMFYGAVGFRDIISQLMVIYGFDTENSENLSPFGAYNQLDPDTKKIITEAAMYAYNHGINFLKDYFKEFMAKYGKIKYEEFTGPWGQWLSFVVPRTENLSRNKRELVNFIYQTSAALPGYKSNTVGKVINMSEDLKALNVSPDKCSYY